MRDWCEEQGDRLRGKKQERVPGIEETDEWLLPYRRAALAVAAALLLLIVAAGFAFALS